MATKFETGVHALDVEVSEWRPDKIPYVFVYTEDGGDYTGRCLSISQARSLAKALLQAADHVEALEAEAKVGAVG